jgi:hypothetical protein
MKLRRIGLKVANKPSIRREALAGGAHSLTCCVVVGQVAVCAPGTSDFKQTVEEFGSSLLAVVINCEPGAPPPAHKIVQYIRSRSKTSNGWGNRVCFVMLPCQTKQQEDERPHQP